MFYLLGVYFVIIYVLLYFIILVEINLKRGSFVTELSQAVFVEIIYMAPFYNVFTLETTLKNMLMVNEVVKPNCVSDVRTPGQGRGGTVLSPGRGQRHLASVAKPLPG